MRFCKYWAIGAIVITLLSACSDFRQGNSPSSTSKDFTLHAVSGSEHLTNRNIELITSVYGISSQASTETGLYEIVPSGTKGSNIIYTDFDSKQEHIYATDLNVCTKMKTAPRGLPLTPV